MDNGKSTELARVPKQARSLKKFEAVLTQASRLFHERGYGDVSVREIAREANVPIATVYQYFPNKLSIVRQLWQSYTSTLSNVLEEQFSRLTRRADAQLLADVVNSVVNHMHEHHQQNREFLEVWRTVEATPELRALDLEDTFQVADSIVQVILELKPESDEKLLMSQALIICETSNATVKRVQLFPEELQRNTLATLKVMLIRMVGDLIF